MIVYEYELSRIRRGSIDKTRGIFIADLDMRLSPIENEIIRVLIESRGAVVTYERMCDSVPHYSKMYKYGAAFIHILHMAINRIKNKIGDGVIWNVPGHGYIINPDEFETCKQCGRVM